MCLSFCFKGWGFNWACLLIFFLGNWEEERWVNLIKRLFLRSDNFCYLGPGEGYTWMSGNRCLCEFINTCFLPRAQATAMLSVLLVVSNQFRTETN